MASVAVASWVVPVAAAGILELLAGVGSAPRIDAPYVARFAGGVLLVELAAAGLAGALWSWVAVRLGEPGGQRASGAVALGLAAALSVLFAAANGLEPRLDPASGMAARLGAALAAALVFGGAAWALGRGRPRFAGIVGGPALLATAGIGVYLLLRDGPLPPGSRRGLALWLAAGVAAVVAAEVLERPLVRAVRRPLAWLLALPVLAAILAAGGVALGRSPLAALRPSVSDRPDVVLVVLDTTRADFAPALPGAVLPTPALSALAAQGTRFSRAFSTSCWTLPAHGSLFTGLPPSRHGATWSSPHLDPGVPTLAERFAAAGWRTAAFSANPWISPEFGFERGFERFETGDADRRPLRPGVADLLRRPARVAGAASLFEDASGLTLLSEALRFLDAGDGRPAFVFVNLLEPHLPYAPPRPWLDAVADGGWDRHSLLAIDQDRLRDLDPRRAPSPREIEGLRRLYAAEVAYDDDLLRAVLQRLEQAGRLDSTLVVVTADHGENLGQHPPLDHQLGLWETLVHVPLIVRFPPAVPRGAVSDALVSLEDVPGAVLGLAGAGPPAWAGSLVEGPHREAAFFEYGRPDHLLELIRSRGLDPTPWDRTLRGVRTTRLKWIEGSDGRDEAYDLEADPGEKHDLVEGTGSVPARFAPLEAMLAAARKAGAALPARPSEPEPRPSEQTLEKLRSLGYLP